MINSTECAGIYNKRKMTKAVIMVLLAALLLPSLASCKPDIAETTDYKTDDISETNEITEYNTADMTADETTAPDIIPRYAVTKNEAAPTIFPTDDVLIYDIDATSDKYGADPKGIENSTSAIKKALSDCADAGGGTVYLPAGVYKVTSSIQIPAFVTLRGDWCDPEKSPRFMEGTVICADVKSSDSALPALFSIGGSAGVLGLTVYYPGQDINDVKPYPFTFYINGLGSGYMLQSVINCTVVNGYRGIGACIEGSNAHEMMTVDTLRGTFLNCGAEVYNQADVGTWADVVISPDIWASAGERYGAPKREEILAYTKENTTGLILGDLEWTEFCGMSVTGCKTGISIVKGKRIEFAGSLYNVEVSDCKDALVVNSIDERWGMVVAQSSLQGDEYAVLNRTNGDVKLLNTVLKGKTKGIIINTTDDILIAKKTYKKPSAFIYSGDFTPDTDISEQLQYTLDTAAETGGVVYVPAGIYRLDAPISVPSGVELRGSSSVPQRDQSGLSLGTVFMTSLGLGTSSPDTAQALITLNGDYAGINGIRIVYPDNTPKRAKATPYAVRGRGEGVYAVNCCIVSASRGVDFRGCDGHIIKKLVACCYDNTIISGGNGGYIEGCLQNGTVIYRNGYESGLDESKIFNELFEPVTKVRSVYLMLEKAENQTVVNTFAYGVKTLVGSVASEGTTLINIGADNIGDCYISTSGGTLTAVNAMRYNGYWYKADNTRLHMYNILSIGTHNEEDIVTDGVKPDGSSPYALSSCDTVNGVNGVTLEKANVKEGSAAWRAFGKNEVLLTFRFNGTDISTFKNGGYLTMWIYCSDISERGHDGQIEITSSGKCDVNELSWPLNGYVTENGWNYIRLPLNRATRTGGNIDYTSVNYIRIYSLDDTCEYIIDDIRLSKD